MAQNDTIPVKVGVVLDVETPVAKIWLSCLNMGISDFYASHPQFNTRLILNTRNSERDVIGAASAALDLLKNVQVQAILGPQKSSQAKFIINLGQNAHVPILSFSATSPSLTSSGPRNPYFFRTATNDASQVRPISSLVKAFGWREVVPIYADTDYGNGIIPYLVDSLPEVDARVPYRSVIPPSASDDQIVSELRKLMTMQTRVFVVHMWNDLGSRLFTKAHEIGMMGLPGVVWIITQDFTDLLNSLSPKVVKSMQGVLGVKTYEPESEELEDFRIRWKMKFQRENPTIIDAQLNVMGLWAYDSAFALALAVEKVLKNGNESENGKSLVSYEKRVNASPAKYSTDLDSFGVSKIGPKLCEALSSTKFRGLAGDFSLVDGQLQSSTFQIVNVNGNGGREIGFWTPQNGLTRNLSLNSSGNYGYSTSRSNLGPIIWPGESTVVPKGWDIPANYEKRLRIGVPVKDGFKEFVDVKTDPSTNVTEVTGFSIDVFMAAVEKLPYSLPYDFIPFANPNGSCAGTYDEMISEVFYGNYDAVVADATIRGNRSLYVDFTLPYTESGVVMVVPLKENDRKSAWVFLEPLTWDLWVTSTCFFVFIGFVVWVLEHRINEDFRGPPSHQVGTSFWFSFSTMVFAHRERVISNSARFVVIIWVFVVLILTQSYTASLSSLLTVETLQPTVTDIDQLLKNGDKVGYYKNSYVYELLKQQGFPDSNIKAYKSVEDCEDLLSKGSKNGGIAAAIDDSPYMKLFLAQYCSKYKMIGPIFKTAGFGFVFSKGSHLVGDISRAILNVTEGDEMKRIENKWFKDDQSNSCPDSKTRVSANSLSVGSFWGLFLIAGIVSVFALIIFAVMFFYKHRQILLDSKDSMWTRIQAVFKSFDEKDLSSHTFRKSNCPSSTVMDVQNSNCPSSPSNYLVYSGSNSPFYGEQGTLSSDQASPEVALPANIIELNIVPNNEIIRSSPDRLATNNV
ncbi:glutamate receptor 2.8 [Morus notabilis]|uniref:glutamate receptor 2.8 n=1 Tax=Morus notabilis TaxID=981085 RepID=UPI000CECE889|nr:glutamate receptor 2.8 [Morus notabilis]